MAWWPFRIFRQRREMQLVARTSQRWSRGTGAARETFQTWVTHNLTGTRFFEIRIGRRGLCIGWFFAQDGVTDKRQEPSA